MTILHKFSQTANDVANAISKYFVTLDPKDLAEANDLLRTQVAAFQDEAKSPSIQSTIVTFTHMTTADLEACLQEDNALSIANNGYYADGPIEKGRLIRIKTTDQEEDSVGLMKVTLISDVYLVLAPVIADPLQ